CATYSNYVGLYYFDYW
nr:immunoglobulin heavy chain junction region [Mus musculus]